MCIEQPAKACCDIDDFAVISCMAIVLFSPFGIFIMPSAYALLASEQPVIFDLAKADTAPESKTIAQANWRSCSFLQKSELAENAHSELEFQCQLPAAALLNQHSPQLSLTPESPQISPRPFFPRRDFGFYQRGPAPSPIPTPLVQRQGRRHRSIRGVHRNARAAHTYNYHRIHAESRHVDRHACGSNGYNHRRQSTSKGVASAIPKSWRLDLMVRTQLAELPLRMGHVSRRFGGLHAGGFGRACGITIRPNGSVTVAVVVIAAFVSVHKILKGKRNVA
jgi:hypothetical protein